MFSPVLLKTLVLQRISSVFIETTSDKSFIRQPWVVDSQEEVDTLLKGAYDRGLNTWDTANVYSNGISEIMIGKTIKKFNIPRHKLVILSKCFGTVGEEPNVLHIKYPQMKESKDYVNQGGLSRQAIFHAVNASLERLQTSYLDLLQIHRFDATVPVEETMKALHDLVEQGKVRYIGASSMWAYQFAKMQNAAERNGWTKFVSMQVSFLKNSNTARIAHQTF
jgi:aryl-alcohol dehydrogenase-like predicted oxidoreductase